MLEGSVPTARVRCGSVLEFRLSGTRPVGPPNGRTREPLTGPTLATSGVSVLPQAQRRYTCHWRRDSRLRRIKQLEPAVSKRPAAQSGR